MTEMIGIYARVSTEEQAKSGYSLQDQIRECLKKAGSNNVKKYVDEGVSGEFLDRPALSELRRDVRDGVISKVVCLDPDRLARNLMNQLIITDEIDKRAELVFVNGEYGSSPEGKLFYQMRGAISEFEKAKINERMSRGRREKARQGRVLRDFQIYGYDYDDDQEKLVINQFEAEIVRLIFDLFTNKNTMVRGINGIANYLNEQGVPTKKGKSLWHRQVVRQILMNPVYIGEFYQNKWNTEGMLGNKYREPEEQVSVSRRPREEWILIPCPAIIDSDTFACAKQLLQESKRRWSGTSKRIYLLSGLIRCGECGNTMTGRQMTNWGKKVLEYTDVKNTAGAKNKGCGKRVKCKELDKVVWDAVMAWLNQPDEIAAASDEGKESVVSCEEAELARIGKEIEKTKAGRQRLINLLVEGNVGDEDIRQMLKELKEKESRLTKRLDELAKLTQVREDNKYRKNLLQEAAEYYLSISPDELNISQKRNLIRYAVREVRVFRDCVVIYGF